MTDAVKCPGCDMSLPANDVRAQAEHMQEKHPWIIAARLESAGFEKKPDGSWFDTLVGQD